MTSPTPHTPSRPVPAWLGALAEPLYRAAIGRRNRRFDAGQGVVEFDRPCLSVGNLSVGGTGKTPMVARLIEWIREAGLRPVIAMRGYGSSGGLSDEAQEYSRRFPGLPIVAQPDRAHGLIELFNRMHEAGDDVDCIVLDDGFQHRRIARTLDLVLVDATRSPFDDRLLPAGWLREPVESLKRATDVVITHAEGVNPAAVADLASKIAGAHGKPPVAVTRHAWASLQVRTPGGGEHAQPVGWLSGRRVCAVCAIGNPDAFLAAARDAGARIDHAVVLRDHARYSPREVRRLLDAAGGITLLTTEKDWTKLAKAWRPGWPEVARARMELAFDRGEEALRDRVVNAARAAAEAPDPA